MQNITFYARAAETLGEFTDYANAKTKPAPILTRGVAVYLRMRLFKEDGSLDPVPIDTFADVKAWQWVMDDDFDSTSNYILVAQHDQITVEAKTEEIEGESREITEFTIPIPEMNTEELDTVLQKKENVANLNGELVGLNGAGEAVYILQLKGFTVRNRISSAGNPTPITAKYYTAEQTRAIIAGTNAYELARKAEFNIGDRAYYPGEPGYLLVCVDEGTSAADLPALDKTVNLFVDGTVTWQVYDLSASGGGAANITVNDVSPDAEGNILLGAEDISFNFKDSWGNDFPTSSAISNTNLQEFFVSMQSAVFSVDGQYVRTEDGVYTGNIDLKYSCRYDGWIAQMIANEYYEGQVNPDQYEESHILIHEILDRYSCYRVNDKSAGEYNPGEIRLTACDIPLGYYNDEYGNEYPDISINDAITLMMSPPDYASPDTSTYELHTQYMTDRHGWVIVKIFAGEDDGFAFVCFEGSKEMYYTPFKAGGVASICFPVGNFTTWEIVDGGDPVSDATYEILFVPCYTASYY